MQSEYCIKYLILERMEENARKQKKPHNGCNSIKFTDEISVRNQFKRE